jgi:hypothetical protein
MSIQERLLKFVVRANWILLVLVSIISNMTASQGITLGVIAGGLIVTVNFHLLHRTLKRTLTPPHLGSQNSVLVKYYIRFIISGMIIFLLIFGGIVDPRGLFIGLSVVVASITLATICEVKKLIFKEAV